MLAAASIVSVLAVATAQDSISAPTSVITSSTLTNVVTPDELSTYSTMKKAEIELGAQSKLVNDLAQEHRKRAEDAKASDKAELAKWETDLAGQLDERGTALAKQLAEATQQRLAFEQAHTNLTPILNIGAAAAPSDNAEEVLYFGRLDELIGGVQQELNARLDEGTALTLQLHTNNAPEDVARISDLLQANGRQVKVLQREKSDLELKKLEFRALRKRM